MCSICKLGVAQTPITFVDNIDHVTISLWKIKTNGQCDFSEGGSLANGTVTTKDEDEKMKMKKLKMQKERGVKTKQESASTIFFLFVCFLIYQNGILL